MAMSLRVPREDEGEFFQAVKLFHLRLIGLQFLDAAQVVFFQEIHCNIHVVDVVAQFARNDLFTPARQLVKVKKAHRSDCLLVVLAHAVSHPKCTGDKYHHDDECPDYKFLHELVLFSFHFRHPCSLRKNCAWQSLILYSKIFRCAIPQNDLYFIIGFRC